MVGITRSKVILYYKREHFPHYETQVRTVFLRAMRKLDQTLQWL